MKRIVLYLGLLLVVSPTLGAANEASRTLDSDLKTWSRLKRDAGYFTEAGQWRGGLYKKARSTETEQYHCLNHTDTHCTGWNVSESSSKKHETGTCACGETTSPFCQHWTCNTRFEYECGDSDHPKTCIAKESLNCDCTVAANNKRYCWKWRCREDSNILPGGYHEFEDYECVIPDLSEEFCFRWHGNTSSKYVVESSACECFERGESFCNYWQCRERGIIRCAQSNQGWCRLEVAIGVGGGMGLLSLACCIGILFVIALRRRRDETVGLIFVPICFVVACLPWFAGVAIWGGIFGMPWVLLLWSIGVIVVSCAVKRGDEMIEKQIMERTQRGSQNAQRVELTRMNFGKTRAVDDEQSDVSNCA